MVTAPRGGYGYWPSSLPAPVSRLDREHVARAATAPSVVRALSLWPDTYGTLERLLPPPLRRLRAPRGDVEDDPDFEPSGVAAASAELPGQNVAYFLRRRRLFQRAQLRAVGPDRRFKDTNTVFLFELDNFGDIGATSLFPLPLSPLALALLPLGAGALLWFGARPAIEDIVDGTRNLKVLRREKVRLRRSAQQVRRKLDDPAQGAAARWLLDRELTELKTRLALCLQDRLNEHVERVISGALVVPATLLTAAGTFITPGFLVGAGNSTAAGVANLFTGFVGNAPVAAYALLNSVHNVRKWLRITHRLHAVEGHNLNNTWSDPLDANFMVQDRLYRLRRNAMWKGVSSLGIGVGGVLTAVTPIGYAVLVPFAVARAMAEHTAQNKLGYTRKLYNGQREDLSRRALLNDLLYSSKTYNMLKAAKQQTRQRFAWGVHAPIPAHWVMKGIGALRSTRLPLPLTPALRVYQTLSAYRCIQHEWLHRKQATVQGDKLHYLSMAPGAPSAADVVQLNSYEMQLAALGREDRWLERECETIKQQNVGDMYGSNAYAWVERLIEFFVDTGLFTKLSRALYRDEVLKATLGPALVTRGKNIRISAPDYLASLRDSTSFLVRQKGFLDAFYACIERVLLTDVKQHYSELRRELMDIITARIWLYEHPAR